MSTLKKIGLYTANKRPHSKGWRYQHGCWFAPPPPGPGGGGRTAPTKIGGINIMLDKGPSNYSTNDFEHVFYLYEPKASRDHKSSIKSKGAKDSSTLRLYQKKERVFFFRTLSLVIKRVRFKKRTCKKSTLWFESGWNSKNHQFLW